MIVCGNQYHTTHAVYTLGCKKKTKNNMIYFFKTEAECVTVVWTQKRMSWLQTQPLRFISDSSSCDRETLGHTTHLSDEW